MAKEGKEKQKLRKGVLRWKTLSIAACSIVLAAVIGVGIYASLPDADTLSDEEGLAQSEQVQTLADASIYTQESYDSLKDALHIEYKGKNVKLAKLPADAYTGFMFKPDASKQGYDALEAKLKSACKKGSVKKLSDGSYVTVSLDVIASLACADQLEYVEPDYVVTLAGSTSNASKSTNVQGGTAQNPAPDWPPTDTRYVEGDLWNLDMLEVDKAWKLGLDGDPYMLNKKPLHDGAVKVAVIDSGLYGTGAGQSQHEDINYDQVITGKNYVTSDEGTPDTLGHGTFVSGLIAAKVNNGKGVAGAMPGVSIVTEKVFDSKSGSTSDIVEAIYDAVNNQAVDVINMSLGGEGNDTTLKAACEYATQKGILVVASAGNDGVSTPNYPAAYDCVVGVASVDKNKVRSTWSQYGKSVFVTAPGEDLTSTYCENANSYRTGSGTSFSGPEVSALAAMCKSIYPEMTQDIFMEFLINTSTDLGSKGYDDYYGYGLVSFSKMAQALMESQALPWYKVSFDVKDQQGKTLNPDSIVVSAAEDISWEADTDAGIDKDGSWKKGTVIKPNEDGTYYLHKGNYAYTVVLDGKYTVVSTFKTYAENQSVAVVMDDAQEVSVTPTYSSGAVANDAKLSITNSEGGVETAKRSNDATSVFDLCSGTYSFVLQQDGYEKVTGSFVVQRSNMQLNPVLYKKAELSAVSFACVNDDDGEVITAGLGFNVYNASNMGINPDDEGIYHLARGQKYKVIISKLGYEDKSFDLTVEDKDMQEIVARLIKAECTISFKALDEEGNIINDASIVVTSSDGKEMTPSAYSPLRYYLKQGTYTYKMSADGYADTSGTFGVSLESRTLSITMKSIAHKLSFEISDDEGQALSDASIKVTTSSTLIAIPAASDGTYQLTRGSYRYLVYKSGYVSARGSFDMGGQDKVIQLSLKKTSEVVGNFEGGSGTVEDPYQIATEEQLRYLAAQTTIERVGKTDASTNKKETIGGYYELVNDIALTKEWTPIGNFENSSNYVAFSGHFDGMGHTISGLVVNGEDNGTLLDAQGLFGYVESATILNLTVEGTVSGDSYVGGLVGRARYSYDETYSDWNTSATLIKGCKNKATVNGRYAVGGIIGIAAAAMNSSSVGLPGDDLGIRVSECVNTGTISATKNGQFNKNATCAGGIVGSATQTQFDHCYSKGIVKAGARAGGIAGSINSVRISNCYAVDAVSIYVDSQGYTGTSGGVVGLAYSTAINDSYALNNSKSTSQVAVGAPYNSEIKNVAALDFADMYRSTAFITKINTDSINEQVGASFVMGNDYPLLSWETADGALLAKTPHITLQPKSNSESEPYKVGDNVEALTAQVDELDDGGQLTWQWFGYKKDSGNAELALDGANGTGAVATYVPPVDEPGIYSYRVVFINTVTAGNDKNASSESSEYATIYVRSQTDAQAPEITALNPSQSEKFNTNLSAKETSDLELSVQAESKDGGQLSYQWYKSTTGSGTGTAISGATQSTYTVDTSSMKTTYYCVKVTNKTEPGNMASVLSDWIKVEVKSYTIETYEELVSFRSAVNAGQSFKGHTVYLKADIEIPSSQIWEPIGTYEHPFAGTFMGGSGHANSKDIETHTISGLNVNGESGDGYYQGFFGVICDAAVYDLNISGSVRGTENIYAGLLVGLAMSGRDSSNPCEIANCSTLAGSYVEGKYYVGGLVGYGNVNLADSANHADVVGCAFAPTDAEKASYSFNKFVWGVGGVIGNEAMGYVRGCYNTGTVTTQEIASSQKCALYVGGVMGYSTTYAEIESCFNSGTITIGTKAEKETQNGALYVGSVAGYVSYEQYLNMHYLEGTYSCGVNTSSGKDYSEYHSLAFMKSKYFVSLLNDGTYANQFVQSKYGVPRLVWEEDTSVDDGVKAPAEPYITDIQLKDAPDLTSTWKTYYYQGENPSVIHVYADAADSGALSYRWQSRTVGASDNAWTDIEGSGSALSVSEEGTADATYVFDTSKIGTREYRCVIRNTMEDASVSPNYIEAETPAITVEIRDNTGMISLKDPAQANSKENPWVISTPEQLRMFSNLVSGDAKLVGLDDASFANQYVSLEADIDLSKLGDSFNPIGNYSKQACFSGCFMGNNHVISGLSIKRTKENKAAECEYQALFAYLAGAYIKDLEVRGTVDVGNTQGFATGGVAAYSNTTIFENVTNCVNVKGYDRVGGVVAYAYHSVLYDCENQASVATVGNQGESYMHGYDVGGIVGSLVAGANDGSKIGVFNCYNAGKVTGCVSMGDMRFGAVVGSRTTTNVLPIISNCYYLAESVSCLDETSYGATGCGQATTYPEPDAKGFVVSIDDVNSPNTAWLLNTANSTQENSSLWGVYASDTSYNKTEAIRLVHGNQKLATYRVDVQDLAADIAVSSEYPAVGDSVQVDYTDKPGFVVSELKYKVISTDEEHVIETGTSFEMPASDISFVSTYKQDLSQAYTLNLKPMLYGGASIEADAAQGTFTLPGGTAINSAKQGQQVTVKLKVADQYQIKELVVEDAYGVPTKATRLDGLTYQFSMPAANTIVKLVLEKVGTEASGYASSLDVNKEAVHRTSSSDAYKTGSYLWKTIVLSGSAFGPGTTNVKTLEDIERNTVPGLYEQEYSFADGDTHRYTGYNVKQLLERLGLSANTSPNTQVIFESADGDSYACTWKDISSLAYSAYDSTKQPIMRGLPVLLTTGVDGKPNAEGLNIVFGQTSPSDNNAAKMVKNITRIVIGNDVNYAQHVWSPYNDINNLGGSTRVKINIYSGSELVGIKTYSITDIEAWANKDKAGIQRGTYVTAIYENDEITSSGPYADEYEGFDLSKIFAKAGISKVEKDALHETKVQFYQNSGYAESWKTVNVSMDYIMGNGENGYGDYSDYFSYASDSAKTAEYKQTGVRPMIAYGKNGYPLVLYSGSKGMVQSAYNYRGPLIAILPQNAAEGGSYVADKTCAACYLSDIDIHLPEGTKYDPAWGEDGSKSDDNKGDDGKQNTTKDTRLSAGSSFASGSLTCVVQKGKKTVYIKAKSKKIKKLSVPSTVKDKKGNKYTVVGISKSGFKNCKKLTKVTGGKYLKVISSKAFYGCKKLKTVTCSSKVLYKIGSKAFYKTSKLTKITIKKTTRLKTVTSAFKRAGKSSDKKLTVKVKSSKKKAYKKLILKKGGNKKLKVR